MSFNIWVNPKTEQERIYIYAGQLAKVWIEQCEPDPVGQDYTVKTSSRDIHEFNIAANTIADAKHAVFTDALGLDPMASGKAVLELAPDFQTIKALAGEQQ